MTHHGSHGAPIFCSLSILAILLLPLLCTAPSTMAKQQQDEQRRHNAPHTSDTQRLQQHLKHIIGQNFQYGNDMNSLLGNMLHEHVFHTKYGDVSEDGEDILVDSDHMPQGVQQIMNAFFPSGRSNGYRWDHAGEGEEPRHLEKGWKDQRTHHLNSQTASSIVKLAAENEEKSQKNPCHEGSIWAEYTILWHSCNGTNVTQEEYDELNMDLDTKCIAHNVTEQTCFCPLDMQGPVCNYHRPFDCHVNMHEPKLQCEEPEDSVEIGGLKLDGDFPCLRFASNATVNFVFSMNCTFSGAPAFELNQNRVPRDDNTTYTILGPDPYLTNETMTWTEIRQLFQYDIHSNQSRIPLAENETLLLDPTFALREIPSSPMNFRPFNFYSMGDITQTKNMKFDNAKYFIGQQRYSFQLKFAELPEEYFAGSRLYIEIGFMEPSPGMQMHFERVFVDFLDRAVPPYIPVRAIVLATTIPAAVVLVAVIGLIALGVYLYRRHQRIKMDRFLNPLDYVKTNTPPL